MRVARGWPVAFAWVAVLSIAMLPLVYGNWPVFVTLALLAPAATAASLGLRRAVPLDLTPVRQVAYPVLPHPDPGPLKLTKPWSGAGTVAAGALIPALWGAYFAGLAANTTGDDATGNRRLAIAAWVLALVVLGWALSWPFRLRRAAGTPPVEVDLICWTERKYGYTWLLVAPANATAVADVVGMLLCKGVQPPTAFAGRLRVHGRLAPWHVAIIRAPDGTAYWPRSTCLGSNRLAAKRIDAQPGA